jgi:hypothetical protein
MVDATGASFDRAQTIEALAAVADDHRDEATAARYRAHAYGIYREIGHHRADALAEQMAARQAE